MGGIGGSTEKNKAIVQINSRLVSTTTGEILAAAQGEGKANKGGGGISLFGVSGNTSTDNIDSLSLNYIVLVMSMFYLTRETLMNLYQSNAQKSINLIVPVAAN